MNVALQSARPVRCRDSFRFQKHLLALGVGALCWAVATGAEVHQLSRETLLDRIKGGWAGQMIGVSYGAPTEFRSMGKINDRDLKWSDDMLANTLGQDDLYVEMTFSAWTRRASNTARRSRIRNITSGTPTPGRAGRSIKASRLPGRAIPNTTSTPTTLISKSRRTSSASCAPGCRTRPSNTATALAAS